MTDGNNFKKQYKIGTRGSLLAVTQCTQTKIELEQKSGANFELEKITTQGDQITDKPLWQIDGKDFFTKELDQALLSNQVDLVVHSYKDLGSVRPDGIEIASITKRKFAHDILLIEKSTIKDLKNKKTFVVGTSSPRRTENIKRHLKDFLPHGENLEIKVENLRGNVNTRIEKLKTDQYDAIILAMAGIERLASKDDSKKTLSKLLDGVTFMILPQKYFTSAASQGALAIECNENASSVLKDALKEVHDDATAQAMKRERKAFASYGGGCHLAVGIHVTKIQDFFVHFHNGTHEGKEIKHLELEDFDYTPYKGKSIYFVFKENDFLIEKKSIHHPITQDNVFITSTLCMHNINEKASSLWASGNRTMKQLTQKDYWVNGSAEGFGHQEILNFKNSKAISLMLETSSWKVLSHKDASSSVGTVVPSYEHIIREKVNSEFESQMLGSDIIYWSSYIQYAAYTERYPELKNKHHAVGLGKTYTSFKEAGITFIPCLDMNHLNESVKG